MIAIDTHTHIHAKDYPGDAPGVYLAAQKQGVGMICVGTTVTDSKDAIRFAKNRNDCWATAGIHPHEATKHMDQLTSLESLLKSDQVVGIGECGLDYWYGFSDHDDQIAALTFQMQLAAKYNIPISVHLRGSRDDPDLVFNEFLTVYDDIISRGDKLKGVVHSFTSGQKNLKSVLSRSLLVGINGIATFSKDSEYRDVLASIPDGSFVLETDAPYLTPAPKRGRVNEPSNILLTARFLSELRKEPLESILNSTTVTAQRLFSL